MRRRIWRKRARARCARTLTLDSLHASTSAHSFTLSEFGGGDGQIGIHGTNQPDSIGTSASHGCVRVPNEVITALAGNIPLGTPVTITA